jgi:A/G-specific adenine glycosylase
MAHHASRITHHAPSPQRLVPKLLAWFAAHARDLPWRRTRDPYGIWVSEIMLQQTQVKTVIPYWERWMRELPTIKSLAHAKPEKIHKLWEGLGYYTRVRNMQKAAQQIIGRRRGDQSLTKQKSGPPRVVTCQFPTEFDAILALPGIGRYTAGAIASIAFNQPAPILDGNVIRVLTRLHGIGEDPQEKKTNARLWQLAEELVTHASRITHHKAKRIKNPTVPPCSALNQSLMELGALLCTPRSPNCADCPVATHCTALRENRIAELPRPKQRAVVTARRFVVFVVERHGKFLVQQRAGNVVNAHLWEFPNREAGTSEPSESVAQQHFQTTPKRLTPLCVVNHSITRYRIRAEAYRVAFAPDDARNSAGTWRTLAELSTLPFTSAHRQIADRLEKLRAIT